MSAPGATIEVPLRFTQADFDEFARLSGDDNPIHVDPDFSARTRFGRTVAHGMLLFGVLDAAVGRWLGEPATVRAQELTFRAPTFADDDLVATLTVRSVDGEQTRIDQQLRRSDGAETAAGFTIVGPGGAPDILGTPPPRGGELFGIGAGASAATERVISADEVAAYRVLVGDAAERHDGMVPPALLGGLVSHLLGVEVPGRGTNWLRQRYEFHDPVPIGSSVTTTVEVIRVRPEKALVDLATTCRVAGRPVVTGRALVLIADLEQP